MSNSTTNENKAEAPEKEDAITNYIRDTDLQSVIAGLWWTQGKTEIGQNSKRSLKRSRLKRPLLLTVPPHNNFQLNISGHTSKCRRPLFNEIFPPFCLKIFSILCSAAGSNSSVSGIEFVWKQLSDRRLDESIIRTGEKKCSSYFRLQRGDTPHRVTPCHRPAWSAKWFETNAPSHSASSSPTPAA